MLWNNDLEDLFQSQETDKKDYFEYFQKIPLDELFCLPGDPIYGLDTMPQVVFPPTDKVENLKSEIKLKPEIKTTLSIGDLNVKSDLKTELKPVIYLPTATPADTLKPTKRKVFELPPEEKEKKEHHNNVEKKRRKKINSELQCLKEMIPYCKDTTTNKLTVLQLACKYISNLQETQKKLMDTNVQLKEVNEQLQGEVRDCHKLLWEKDPAAFPLHSSTPIVHNTNVVGSPIPNTKN
eukprot:TRINITY_DN3077_c0_g1_i1.p1 TRINITY_DN3077_c0_g1~~TRINITY_DN3077_c0_g1_i1.p1  ORF type:complete len:237 (-),score=46.10 TRINITY_DN3077_c0_g1_i1:209-919(-)